VIAKRFHKANGSPAIKFANQTACPGESIKLRASGVFFVIALQGANSAIRTPLKISHILG
jgi:F0F1-type ATP synthase assembly protein I